MYGALMTTVQYFTACTLDGFIADENNSLDWLFEAPHEDGDGGWEEFISGVGPMVMGATTYEWMLQRHDMLSNPQQWRDFYGDRPRLDIQSPRPPADPRHRHSSRIG